MGRSSFAINPKRLKGLREEAGFTQLKLVSAAYKVLGRSPKSSDRTLLSHYQKIERYGRTSRKLAKALADVLLTTVEVLQGTDMPESYDYVDKIAAQLQAQLADGDNTALEQEIAKLESEGDGGHVSREEAVRSLASYIGSSIERAQLMGDEEELAQMGALTGWSHEQLLNPANVYGHWFVRSSVFNNRDHKMIYGVTPLFMEAERVLDQVGKHFMPDLHISIRHKLPWIHMEVDCPGYEMHYHTGLMFARALPRVDGLKWVAPSESEKCQLKYLNEMAFRHANFVTLNGADCCPADVRNLRLKVVEYIDGRQVRKAYTVGSLHELQGEHFNNSRVRGWSHRFVMSRLTHELAEGLTFCMANVSEDAWEVSESSNSIRVELKFSKLPFDQLQSIGFFSYLYNISLVEAMPDGSYRPAPWARQSIETDCKNFKEQLERAWNFRQQPPGEEATVLHFVDIEPQGLSGPKISGRDKALGAESGV